jgi:sec-independent protein translocase protein TatB
MFDVGFSEIALVAVVALLVLGPERLPKVARTVGALVRRARSSWQNVRTEIERELAAEDLKKTINETRRAADVRSDMHAAASDVEAAMRGTTSASTSSASTSAAPTPSTPPPAQTDERS